MAANMSGLLSMLKSFATILLHLMFGASSPLLTSTHLTLTGFFPDADAFGHGSHFPYAHSIDDF